MTPGERITLLRKQNEVKQKDLAKHLKIEASTLSCYEAGKRTPNLKTLTSIADYFSVSTDYLLGRTDIQEPGARIESEWLDLIELFKNQDITSGATTIILMHLNVVKSLQLERRP